MEALNNLNDDDIVTFMSYNPTGLDSSTKCGFINEICDVFDVDFLNIKEQLKWTKTTNSYLNKNLVHIHPL